MTPTNTPRDEALEEYVELSVAYARYGLGDRDLKHMWDLKEELQNALSQHAPIEGLDEALEKFKAGWALLSNDEMFLIRDAAISYAQDRTQAVPQPIKGNSKCKECDGEGGWWDTDEPKYNEGWIQCSCVTRAAPTPPATEKNVLDIETLKDELDHILVEENNDGTLSGIKNKRRGVFETIDYLHENGRLK